MQIGVDSEKSVENKRLFVIDSDEITRSVLQFMLHDENETHEMSTLEAAYTKAADWKPDGILLGIAIVADHGVGVIQEIKSRLNGVRIMLIAKTDDDPLLAAGKEAGADVVMAKPLVLEKVRDKVDGLLGRRRKIGIPVQMG